MVVDFRSAPDPAAPRGPRWRVGAGAVVVLVLAVLAITVLVSATATRGGAGETAITSPPSSGQGSAAPSGPPGSPGPPVFVHVHGRVAQPGLYELAAGARVVDVVAAAGGFTEDADQGAVNLARPLVDGEQLLVPAVGEVPAGGSGAGGTGAGAGAGSGAAGAGGGTGGGLVDLNSADATALETLPGVGPATSAAVLEWRRQNGSFRSVDDLLEVPGIGEKTLESLRPLVTV
jgi:competence protein ComEA